MGKYAGVEDSRGSRHDMWRDREASYAPNERSGEMQLSSAYPTKSASRKGKKRGRKERAFEKRR